MGNKTENITGCRDGNNIRTRLIFSFDIPLPVF